MREIFPGIYTWEWYSEEKGMNFNGYLVVKGEERVIIDPPLLSQDDLQLLQRKEITGIILTNRDHVRESMSYRTLFNTKIWAPEADAPQMESVKPDQLYKDGDVLPADLKVVSLADGKSPGESALYLSQSGGIFIVGDALIGKPEGRLNLMSPDKYSDILLAKAGLRKLLYYNFDVVLVGDGASILKNGKQAVKAALR